MINQTLFPTLYICGDSFCSTDHEYGQSWVDHLIKQLPHISVVNLASPGASNYQIYLQVRHALEQNCQYLIYHATSSIRHEFCLNTQSVDRDSADRYWNRSMPEQKKPMVCTSWLTPENSLVLSTEQAQQIKTFYMSFIDLPAEIEKNYLFILSTLQLIQQSNVLNWIWSRGGFEHTKFTNNQSWNFDAYLANECKHNLWDHYDSTQLRPFYHVTDIGIITKVCNDYIKMLQLNHDSNQKTNC